MGRLVDSIVVEAPVVVTFGYVDDWRNAPRYVRGLRRWEPVDGREHGLGARFDAEMEVGPVRERSLVEVTAWERDRMVGWDPIEGFRQSGRWTFEPDGERTRVTFDVEYVLPGGMAGRLLAKTAEPLARQNVKLSLRDLKEQVEALHNGG